MSEFYFYEDNSDPDITRSDPPRSKWDYPYSYDPILVYRNSEKATGTVYSDRLLGWWGYESLEASQKKHNFKGWNDPKVAQAILSEYMKKNIEVTKIIEYCNQSDGYPVWRLDFREIP